MIVTDKTKSISRLKESFYTETVEDILYCCTNADDVQFDIIDDYLDNLVYSDVSSDDIGDDVRECEFIRINIPPKAKDIYHMFAINVSDDKDNVTDGTYEHVSDFLDDVDYYVPDTKVSIFNVDTEEEIYSGKLADLPADILDMYFVSFDAPDKLEIYGDFSSIIDSSEDLVEDFKSQNDARFKDDDICIYLLPYVEEVPEDIQALKDYHIEKLGLNFGPNDDIEDECNNVIRGTYANLCDFCDNYIGGYEMHPDYLYAADDFAGKIYPEDSSDLVEAFDYNSIKDIVYVDYSHVWDRDPDNRYIIVNENFFDFDPEAKHVIPELEHFASQIYVVDKRGTGWRALLNTYCGHNGRKPNKDSMIECCYEGQYTYDKVIDYLCEKKGIKRSFPFKITTADYISYVNEKQNMFYPWQEKNDYDLVESVQGDRIDNFIDELYIMRQAAIQKDGEYSLGNLIFKELRNRGYLDNLKELKIKETEKDLSL